uniref:Tubulin-specific chaperone E n=1 Tax=Labrus bergylta TaxID=56723 RepID=A0A3Q3FTH5_9LABR|nr:tubulin-specific chaperone E isoform X1 [Labrus bergylta]XP_020511637.1 tubulin-specific chaperone E isoform X1 [Labrus bergylta]XP_029137479.1 tubulin-specific chaperone E isoform X1 [Labrus bergylta]
MGVDHTEPEVPEDAVGRRVSCDGERATVRYVGSVPPTAGLWLGVEWDNPERGKHDGSHNGVQYFTCRHPKGGSFVRPAKVSFGVDYLTAVEQQYVYETDKSYVDWEGRSKKLSHEMLTSVLLCGCEVNGSGPGGEIRKKTPQVQWLDLSKTLMSCWEDVSSITQQLDQLEGLQLSSNRLRLLSEPSSHSGAFLKLKTLALNSCDLTWPQILECAPMWPQLEVLSVEENDITELQRPEGVLQTLNTLSLSGNALVQDSVLKIAALPRLEELNLSRTGLTLTDLRFDDAAPGSLTAMFPALKNLYLDHNNIAEWRVVDEFAKLPSLVKFSCLGNRLASKDGNPRTATQLMIAKLGRLVVLNRCEIHPDERRGAELDYLKMFGEEWLKAGGGLQPDSTFTCQHPRYLSLIDKYGAPEEGELKKQEAFALKNQLLKVVFVFPDDAERKPIEKKLPASMVIQKVKGLLYRLLKVPAVDLKLTYTSPKKEGTEFEIGNDLKSLQFYSIEAGDKVLVRWS